jgi:hypothetical protein
MRPVFLLVLASLTTSQVLIAGEEIQRLVDALCGRWSITQQNADDTTVRGEEAWYVAPGGTPLVEEYRVKDSGGRDIADYATIWWDAAIHRYSGSWCADFTDEGCTPFDAEWHGSTIELRGTYSVHGKHFRWRELFEISSHDSFTQTLYIGADGEELRLRTSAHGTRLAASASPSTKPQ